MQIGPNRTNFPTFTQIDEAEGDDDAPENLDESSLEHVDADSESLTESVVLDNEDCMFSLCITGEYMPNQGVEKKLWQKLESLSQQNGGAQYQALAQEYKYEESLIQSSIFFGKSKLTSSVINNVPNLNLKSDADEALVQGFASNKFTRVAPKCDRQHKLVGLRIVDTNNKRYDFDATPSNVTVVIEALEKGLACAKQAGVLHEVVVEENIRTEIPIEANNTLQQLREFLAAAKYNVK